MTFDILNCVLTTAERAVKIMKQQEKNKQEDEMMKALEGVNICGQVALDSADGNLIRMFLQQENENDTFNTYYLFRGMFFTSKQFSEN